MSTKRKQTKRPISKAWGEWLRCDTYTRADGTTVQIPAMTSVFRNNVFTVSIDLVPGAPGFGKSRIAWLSIKRNDRGMIRDWREFQRIKNELLGAEVEAVELYPAESRLVDTSNQFHLWAVLDEGYRFPFGYEEREVLDSSAARLVGAKQRALPEGTVTTPLSDLVATLGDSPHVVDRVALERAAEQGR